MLRFRMIVVVVAQTQLPVPTEIQQTLEGFQVLHCMGRQLFVKVPKQQKAGAGSVQQEPALPAAKRTRA